MKSITRFLLASVAAVSISNVVLAQEKSDVGKWYVSPGVGVLIFEGNEPANPGAIGLLRVGYEATDHLTFEFGGLYGPRFSEHDNNKYGKTGFKPAEAWGVFADVLYHFNRMERWDPYVFAGVGYMRSPDQIMADQSKDAFTPRLGGGLIWHWTDSVSLRANATLALGINSKVEAMPMFDLGMIYRFGGSSDQTPVAGDTVVASDVDTDGDGLSDAEEARLGTNPRLKDTDGDGLTDGEEVNIYKTDPLNRDTDFDGLSDGDEVLKYKTDPLKRDTDGGGVSDGHEVLEDGTDPLNKNDDLMLFELEMEFGYDQTIIQPQYYPKLDVVAKVLERHPEATAVIEGHADRRAKSDAKYNQDLSEKRAEAAMKYLMQKGVQNTRMRAVGFGFTRPKVQPDLVNGNPENRRVDIYIRGAGGLSAKEAFLKEASIQ